MSAPARGGSGREEGTQPAGDAPGDVADAVAVTLAEAGGRRSVPVLAAAQVLGGIGVASGVAVNGILAQDLSGSTSMSGLAQTMGVIGAAALAVPLARVALRSGRRPALTAGYTIGAVGAALSLAAGGLRSFPLLLVGALLFGGGSAAGLQARYAAIDGVPAQRRGRALSFVVWATTVGAVAGPNLTGPGAAVATVLHLPPLVGPFVFALAGYSLAALAIQVLLRPDPLAAALAASAARLADGAAQPRGGTRHAFAVAVRSPDALLGLVTVGVAHAVMVAVMVMTPVHMHDGGAALVVVGLVISAHIAGMYAASPLWGWLSDRYGRRTGIASGVAVLAAACAVAAAVPPDATVLLGVALALLGLGWSACVVSGSTLLSESVPVDVRTSVQGLSDLVMGTVAASAGVLAGPVVEGAGYPALAVAAGAMLVAVLALLARRARPAALAG